MATGRNVILLLALLTASCAVETVREVEIVETRKVPVNFSVTVDPAGTSITRASDWEYNGYFPTITPEEKKVTDLLIVAFKSFILTEYTFFDESDLTVDASGNISISGQNEEEDNVLNLEPGAYHFYVMMNIPPDLKTRICALLLDGVGSLNKDSFEREVLQGVSLDYLTKSGGGELFFMTNSTPPQLQGIYSEEQMAGTGLNNNITVSAGRAVAKVSLAYVANRVETGELHGSLTNIKYRVMHNPANMYLMPVMENNILMTPHYRNAFDPVYFTPQVEDLDLANDDGGWVAGTTDKTIDGGYGMEFAYCIENNNLTPVKQGNSTMLLVEAVFVPKSILNRDGTPGYKSTDGTFWRIMRTTKGGVELDYDPGYYNEEPTPQFLEKEYYGQEGTYKTVEFKQGKCYYGFWLEKDGVLMLQRNNFYRVAITHIHSSGAKEPNEIIEPDKNLEGTTTYGRPAVIASDWNEYNQNETVGE